MVDQLTEALSQKLGVIYSDDYILKGKGGFWVKGNGFYTLAQARKITGIKATPRPAKQVMLPWGDYATIAQINRVKL